MGENVEEEDRKIEQENDSGLENSDIGITEENPKDEMIGKIEEETEPEKEMEMTMENVEEEDRKIEQENDSGLENQDMGITEENQKDEIIGKIEEETEPEKEMEMTMDNVGEEDGKIEQENDSGLENPDMGIAEENPKDEIVEEIEIGEIEEEKEPEKEVEMMMDNVGEEDMK